MSRNRSRSKNRAGKMFRPPASFTSKKPQSIATPSEPTGPRAWRRIISTPVVVVLLVMAIICGFCAIFPWKKTQNRHDGSMKMSGSVPNGTVTFNRDIAPIVFQKCARCHRPGQSAPFALLAYEEVKKHARQIVEVTQRRYMPPWLPEPGYGEFAFDRRLGEDQIAMIQQWVAEGAVEGNPTNLLPPPRFSERWQLGQPDLVLTLPQAYALPAEGKDVYRNFVVPIPVSTLHYVKGVEFLPGNAKVVHHAFIDMDETRQSRRLAERQNPPGFDGMELPDSAVMPGGQFLGWQPGKTPYFSSPGYSWVLRTNTDFVLQLHMHPSGKTEVVQPAVGLYFTDQAPTNNLFRVALKCFELDIPAGADSYVVEESYVLPVDLNIFRVSTHAHYLGREMQGYAILPNGGKKWLIWIRNWDFNWQGDYEYASPQFLPKGSRLVMHYTYDNSTNNVHNPNLPPKRVQYGLETTDEMGELWFQVSARSNAERELLTRDYFAYMIRVTIKFDNFRLRLDPENVAAHTRLGRTMRVMGKPGEAMDHLLSAVRIKPDDDKAHYELALLQLTLEKWPEAEQEFLTVTRLNPYDYQAYGNLGDLYRRNGRTGEARECFETALRLNPDDLVARKYLGLLPRSQK